MAKEMMEFTKNSVLMQSAQAMLAQANQQPQSILQLSLIHILNNNTVTEEIQQLFQALLIHPDSIVDEMMRQDCLLYTSLISDKNGKGGNSPNGSRRFEQKL